MGLLDLAIFTMVSNCRVDGPRLHVLLFGFGSITSPKDKNGVNHITCNTEMIVYSDSFIELAPI